jgi:hypothetical protein
MTEYYFGTKKKAHKFCKTCGTSILIDFKRNEYGVTDSEMDQLAVNVILPSLCSISSTPHSSILLYVIYIDPTMFLLKEISSFLNSRALSTHTLTLPLIFCVKY